MATEKNITMKQFNGTDYDTLYPKTIVNQIEDRDAYYFNKSKTLTTDVASMFVGSSVATPNDAFSYLGKYAEYWWKKFVDATYTAYEETRGAIESIVYMYSSGIQNSESFVPPEWSFEYSKSFSIDQSTGVVSLSSPSTFTVPSIGSLTSSGSNTGETTVSNLLNEFLANAPYYCKFAGNDNVYYLPAGSSCSAYGAVSSNDDTIAVHYYRRKDDEGNFVNGSVSIYLRASSSTVNYPAELIGSKAVTYSGGNTYYSYSTNRNAYPDSGTVDSVTYEYLGIPFDNAVTAPKIAVGNYIGTDVYGSSNQNSLMFDFIPKMLIIGSNNSTLGWQRGCFAWVNGVEKGLVGFSSTMTFYTTTITWNDKEVLWYGSNSTTQLNENGKTYYYIAIG